MQSQCKSHHKLISKYTQLHDNSCVNMHYYLCVSVPSTNTVAVVPNGYHVTSVNSIHCCRFTYTCSSLESWLEYWMRKALEKKTQHTQNIEENVAWQSVAAACVFPTSCGFDDFQNRTQRRREKKMYTRKLYERSGGRTAMKSETWT